VFPHQTLCRCPGAGALLRGAQSRGREDGDAPPTFTQRFINEVAYEVIFLAINDQPLPGYVEAGYRYESFLPDPASAHEFRATLGLRLGIPLTK